MKVNSTSDENGVLDRDRRRLLIGAGLAVGVAVPTPRVAAGTGHLRGTWAS